MLKALLLPLFLVLPLGIGMALPQLDVINHGPLGASRLFLVVLIFLSALRVNPAQLMPKWAHARLIAAQLLLGIVPFWAARRLLPERPDFAVMLFFTGIAPTAAVSSAVVGMLRGRVGFTLTGFFLSNVAIALGMIGLLPWVTGHFTLDFLRGVCVTLGGLVFLPAVAAMILRRLWPPAREWPKKLGFLMKAVWIYALFGAGAAGRAAIPGGMADFWMQLLVAAAVSFCFIWTSLGLGLWLSPRRLQSEGGHILWQKNTFFVIAIALTYASPAVILGPILYTFWNNVFNGWLLYRDARRIAHRHRLPVSPAK